jgi:hypothetical protein
MCSPVLFSVAVPAQPVANTGNNVPAANSTIDAARDGSWRKKAMFGSEFMRPIIVRAALFRQRAELARFHRRGVGLTQGNSRWLGPLNSPWLGNALIVILDHDLSLCDVC